MSDQLRCFSQFDLGSEEGWGEDLISAMNGHSALQEDTSHRSNTAEAGAKDAKADLVQRPLQIIVPDPVVSAEIDRQGEKSVTPEVIKSIKRIPIPSLLPPSARKGSLDKDVIATSRVEERPWPSPPPPPPQSRSHSNPHKPHSEAPMPIRRSSESFGVHMSTSKSSVDLSLITPSTSQEDNSVSVDSEEEVEEAVRTSMISDSSDLDFGMALREGGYQLTPQSSISEKLREFFPLDSHNRVSESSQRSEPGKERCRNSSSPKIPARMSHPNPTFSLPQSVRSSLPSRSSTPENSLGNLQPGLSTIAQSPTTPVHPDTRQMTISPRSPWEESRASMALSMMSSEDSVHLHHSLHEATVQMAYTKILNRFGGDERGDSVSVGRPIAEEPDVGETESGRCSAIDALEEAARKIAVRP